MLKSSQTIEVSLPPRILLQIRKYHISFLLAGNSVFPLLPNQFMNSCQKPAGKAKKFGLS